VEGLRTASDFTQVPWVRDQLITKLSMDVHPGTLNLEISEPADLRAFQSLKAGEGIEINPREPSYCSAKCFPVLIAGKVKGAIILPGVPDYPQNKMELIAPLHVRLALSLSVGDVLEVEIL
jgi:CTP-dependent riboflavin kinase